MFTALLFMIDKKQKPPKCPSAGEQTDRTWCIQTMEYYSAVKGRVRTPAAALMSRENLMLRRAGETVTERHTLCASIDKNYPEEAKS